MHNVYLANLLSIIQKTNSTKQNTPEEKANQAHAPQEFQEDVSSEQQQN